MKLINKTLLLTLGMALTLTLSACTGCSPHTWSSESSLSSIESSESESSQSSSQSSSSEISSSEISSSESSSSEEPVIVYYHVTFNANGGHFAGGEEVITREVEEGECVEPAPNPEKEYADFLGWFEDGKTAVFDFTRPIYSDVELYASWLNEEALIISSEIPNSTFNKQERTIDVTVYEGDRYYLSIVNQLTLSQGATFSVFHEGVSCDPNSLSITRVDHTFTIRVTSKYEHCSTDYTLNIHKDYEINIYYHMLGDVINVETIKAAEQYELTYRPNDPVGYYWKYWVLEEGGWDEIRIIDATRDINLYSNMDERFVECIADANGGTFSNGESTYTAVAYISWNVNLVVPTYPGHRFLGYFHDDERITDENGNGVIQWHFFDNFSTTVVAQWEQIDYMQNIKLQPEPDHWWTIGEWPEHIYYGDNYVLPIPCKEWLRFTAWYYGDIQLTDNRGNCLAPWTLADDIEYEIHAEYEEADFTVNYYLNDVLIHTQVESLESYRNNFDLWVYETDNPTFYGWSRYERREDYSKYSSGIVTKAFEIVFDYYVANVYAWIDE